LRLRNPLSTEASNLRTALLPGLLDTAARNRAFGARGGAIFEVGHVFEPRQQPPELRETALHYRLTGEISGGTGDVSEDLLVGVAEKGRVAGLIVGTARPSGWNVPAFTADFFGAKGLVERLVPGAAFESRTRPFLHPGKAAAVLVGGTEVGWVGELHPETAERFELEDWPVAAFELALRATDPDPTPRYAPFYDVPAVSMDLAVLVGEEVRVGDMIEVVENVRSSILAEWRVFDVYKGAQVPVGKKSIALNFTFQAEETLKDEVVKEDLDRIAEKLREAFGAEVRRG
jgi:phenylalanyl-tRNA synthetase beta chain